jgi:PHD/YefM family antitoxin component YafN of YafNO toxin-antitoxin module
MPQIIPIRDLKNTSEISEMCHAVGEPIFVTKNGYGDMVVMSMEAYEERMRMLDVYAKLAAAEDQIKAGKMLSAEDSMKGLREKYGL